MAIQLLINKRDNSELVRDELAAILLAETASQQALALGADPAQDPDLWKLRVFVERSNPWEEFLDATDGDLDTTPIVNVALDNVSYDPRASNSIQRQKATAVYNIDCYGCGISAADGAGHSPGDESAALEAQRCARLVRNILMAEVYAYLGMRGTVWGRWPQSLTMFQPQMEGRSLQRIAAVRFALQVDFNEFSPETQGELLELISVRVRRAETGEVFFDADFAVDPNP